MKFVNPTGESFELRIIGYEYPKIIDDKYDSNWLNIEIEVHHNDGHWIANDPCLLTYEVEKLAVWLMKIASNEQFLPEQDFMEPNLTFKVVEKYKILQIYFELESRPSWRPSNGKLKEDLWVEFPISKLNLNEAVASLRKQLSKYPQRAIKK